MNIYNIIYIFNEKLIQSILSRFLERSYIIEQKSLFTNNKKMIIILYVK